MTQNRTCKLLAPIGLALLAVCFTASFATARDSEGKFTLPCETHWGTTLLPAGDYTFTLDSSPAGYILVLRDAARLRVNIIVNHGVSDHQTMARSELILVRTGGSYRIRALRLAPLELTLEYSIPKEGKQLIAQNPQLLLRIPVKLG